MRYAEGTSVPVEKTRAEIEGILRRYGADGFRYGWLDRDGKRVEQIEFTANARHVRFTLALPSKDDKRFFFTKHRRQRRTEGAAFQAWEQECRRKWRALGLCVKAKLEAVSSGISLFEHEFLAQLVDGETNRTVGELMQPWIEGRLSATKLLGLPAPDGVVDAEFYNDTHEQ